MSDQSAPSKSRRKISTRALKSSMKLRTTHLLKDCQGDQLNKGSSNVNSLTKLSTSQSFDLTSTSESSMQSRKLRSSKQTFSSTACGQSKSLKTLEQPSTSKAPKKVKQLKSQKVSKSIKSARKTNQLKLLKLGGPTTSKSTKGVSCGDETAAVAKRSKFSGKINPVGGLFICSSTITKRIIILLHFASILVLKSITNCSRIHC